MFRDDRQLGDVCFILCAWIPKSPWMWRGDGLGDGYRRYGLDLPSGISTGEAHMLRFAAALWGGDDLTVWRGYDRRRMTDIVELLAAIDEWIAARVGRTREGRPWSSADAKWREKWEADVRSRARS